MTDDGLPDDALTIRRPERDESLSWHEVRVSHDSPQSVTACFDRLRERVRERGDPNTHHNPELFENA